MREHPFGLAAHAFTGKTRGREPALVAPSLRIMWAAVGFELTSVTTEPAARAVFDHRTDTAGSITVRRDTAVAALKKAAELDRDSCWDITITGPDGRRYTMREFDQLPARS